MNTVTKFLFFAAIVCIATLSLFSRSTHAYSFTTHERNITVAHGVSHSVTKRFPTNFYSRVTMESTATVACYYMFMNETEFEKMERMLPYVPIKKEFAPRNQATKLSIGNGDKLLSDLYSDAINLRYVVLNAEITAIDGSMNIDTTWTLFVPKWAIAVIVIAVLAIVACLVFCFIVLPITCCCCCVGACCAGGGKRRDIETVPLVYNGTYANGTTVTGNESYYHYNVQQQTPATNRNVHPTAV